MTNFELGNGTRYYLERNYVFVTVCKSFHYIIVLNQHPGTSTQHQGTSTQHPATRHP